MSRWLYLLLYFNAVKDILFLITRFIKRTVREYLITASYELKEVSGKHQLDSNSTFRGSFVRFLYHFTIDGWDIYWYPSLRIPYDKTSVDSWDCSTLLTSLQYYLSKQTFSYLMKICNWFFEKSNYKFTKRKCTDARYAYWNCYDVIISVNAVLGIIDG